MGSTTHAPRRRNRAAGAGLLLGLAGVGGYFVVVFLLGARLPQVRDDALPNWLLVAAGLLLSTAAVRRTFTQPTVFPGRRSAFALASANVVVAGAFAWLLYGMSLVPRADGPAVGAPAPDFALTDQEGRAVRLADFRGAPLLLVFYRGHW